MTPAEIKKAIRKAKVVFVDVAGTEFWARISKIEALALCGYQGWDMDCDDRPEGLYLSAIKE